jgi:hypothetical protein
MYCPKCGFASADGSRDCVHCGHSLEAGERPRVKPVNRLFYLISVAAAGFCGVTLVIVPAWQLQQHPGRLLLLLPLLLGELALLYSAAVSAVLWYRAWQAVQDGHARTGPGKAIGLLFVPFYNFYWVFEAYWGFARDCNALFERRRVKSRPLPEWLFLLSCILTVASLPLAFVPVARFVFPYFCLGVWVAVVHFVTRAVNTLARA